MGISLYTFKSPMVAVYKDYEPGQRWPAHPDDEDGSQVADSLEELSDLSASDPAPIKLNPEDLKLQRPLN